MLNRTALTVFLYASFLYFLKRIVFVKRHVWFFRIYVKLCFKTYSVLTNFYLFYCYTINYSIYLPIRQEIFVESTLSKKKEESFVLKK